MTFLTRRTFLAGSAAALACSPLPAFVAPVRAFYGARFEGKNNFFASAFDDNGDSLFDLPLPARGHGIALDRARGRVAIFARRPGEFAVIVDPVARAPIATITPVDGNFFADTACFPLMVRSSSRPRQQRRAEMA
jgi:uncharacterized protein